MGKASSSKKVARAASTGGGRTSRGRTPWLWYLSMTAVVTLGILGILVSRSDLDEAAANPPVIGRDHWHAAYGVYVCGQFHPGLTDTQGDRYGIHSHGDGLVHIHPTSANSAGDNARLGVFLDEVGVELTESTLELPDRDELETGQDECDGKPGEVKVVEWETPTSRTEKVVSGDPNDLRLKQAQVITIAFVAKGDDVPQPPSAGNVNSPNDLPGDLGTPPSAPTEAPAGDAPSPAPDDPASTEPPPSEPPPSEPPPSTP